MQLESDHSGDDSSRPPATQTGSLESSGPDTTPGSQPTDPSYKFIASLRHSGPGSGYSNGGTADVPGWAANQAWTSKINDDFMQTMKDNWDNSLFAGGTEDVFGLGWTLGRFGGFGRFCWFSRGVLSQNPPFSLYLSAARWCRWQRRRR